MKNCETKWIKWWPGVYNDNWIWRQIDKLLKDRQKIILKMERSMEGLQNPHLKIWCWKNEFCEQRKGLQGTSRFYHKKWYGETYGLGVFRKRHNSKRQCPRREMQLTFHPSERIQYVYRLQSMVQSCKDQDKARTFIVLDQLEEISSPKSVTS
jgi:hypothetical protein